MKKNPAYKFCKETGMHPYIGTLASESRMRSSVWLKNGCNAFNTNHPQSTPMSFWTEQDVLLYIREKNLKIASVYGDVVIDHESDGQLEGQTSIADLGLFDCGNPLLKLTGVNRTGCMFCGFGCHLEESPNRFERMKITHPKQYEYIMKPVSEGGLGYKEIIEWINENGNLNIKY